MCAEETPLHALTVWCAYERNLGDFSCQLKRALTQLESKFSYVRWEGLLKLVEIIAPLVRRRGAGAAQERSGGKNALSLTPSSQVALKDERAKKTFLHRMAESKVQSKVFGHILDGQRMLGGRAGVDGVGLTLPGLRVESEKYAMVGWESGHGSHGAHAGFIDCRLLRFFSLLTAHRSR